MSNKEIEKLIGLAYNKIIRTKGKEYAPTSYEIQAWIDKNYPEHKIDTKESTDASSSGAYAGPISNNVIKRKINKLHNFNINENVNSDDVENLFNNKPEYLNKIYNLLGYGPKNVIYSAIFFNTEEITSKYKQVHPNLFSHHSTIEFKPLDITNLPIGKEIEVKIIGRLTTDKVDVLIVENPLSKNKFPHITLSTAEGIKPFASNSEIENNQDKIEKINDIIEGVVGIFNGSEEITEINIPEEEKEKIKKLYSDYLSSNKVEDFLIKGFEEYILSSKKEMDLEEMTDASSSGSYDVPLFGGTKGRKNPLSIGGEKSIKSSRAVKDKNFPKWGGPGGKFIKIKDKCKKFPYCNQGDINAIELLENKKNVNNMKSRETAKFADKILKRTVSNILNEEFNKQEKYHLKTKDGKLVNIYDTEHEAKQDLDEYKKKGKQLILSKGPDLSFDEIDEMTEEDCNECGTSMNEDVCPKCKKTICECGNKVYMNESQLISFIKDVILENKSLEKNTQKAQADSKKSNDSYINDVTKKVKDYLNFDGNTNPKFPNAIKGKKIVARQNNESENDEVDLNRGRTSSDLDIDGTDNNFVNNFNSAMEKYMKGSSKTGNEQVDGGNTIPTDTGKDMLELSEKRKKAKKEEKLYPKEAVPVKVEKSKINEDINKMKKLIKF